MVPQVVISQSRRHTLCHSSDTNMSYTTALPIHFYQAARKSCGHSFLVMRGRVGRYCVFNNLDIFCQIITIFDIISIFDYSTNACSKYSK